MVRLRIIADLHNALAHLLFVVAAQYALEREYVFTAEAARPFVGQPQTGSFERWPANKYCDLETADLFRDSFRHALCVQIPVVYPNINDRIRSAKQEPRDDVFRNDLV